MNSQTIDTLKFKAYLKAPRGGSARVELCTNSFGKLFAVKWATEAEDENGSTRSKDIPGSLAYDCFAERENGSYLQHLPTLLGSDAIKTRNRNIGRIVTEYCQGHDLEELVNYASLSGEGLPEAFLWHIINSFIEYCFALSTCYLNLTIFDPAHVLFIFDTPSYANAGESVELQYPRVVFCGLTGIEDRTDECDPDEPATHSLSCIDAIRGFGAYLLSHIESIPCGNDRIICYSQALISWLKIIAGTDDAPPRYIDLYHLLLMLHTRIEEYRGPVKSLKLTPWLSHYFKQLQLESDTQYSGIQGSNREDTRLEIEDFVSEVRGYYPAYEMDLLPPKILSNEDTAKLAERLSIYFDKITHSGMNDEQWYVQRWRRGVSPMSLEEIRGRLSEFMHKSLERSIALGKWGGIWMAQTSNISFAEVPMTRAIFDSVEPEILQRLVRALARCQQAIAEQNRKGLMNTVQKNLNRLNSIHKDNMDRILRLLNEIEIRYQAAFNRAAWDGDRWKWYHREVRSTIQVRTSLLEWEKWFTIQIRGLEMAREFAQDPTFARGESAEQFLRLELDIPLKKRLKQLTQDKIVARGDMANEWFERKNAGHMYAVPDWKEDSEDLEQRHARYDSFDQNSWTRYLNELRTNGTEAAQDLHSPKNMSQTDPLSPKVKITGKVEHAKNAEEEYRKMTKRPRLAPRCRRDITTAELRVFKIMKRWRQNFAKDDAWYTDAGLFENFRQQLRRQTRSLETIRSSFNRRGQNIGGRHCQLDPSLIETYEDALEHVEWYLMTRDPKKDLEEMSLCSSASDSSLPVEEKPELWDVSDSSGTEDDQGRWVSKGNKK